jgi:hypothetical protein
MQNKNPTPVGWEKIQTRCDREDQKVKVQTPQAPMRTEQPKNMLLVVHPSLQKFDDFHTWG